MKIRVQNDLLLLNIITVLLILIIAFLPSNVLRIVFGLPFVLLFPGYILTVALFSRRNALDGIERIALSLGFSIVTVPFIGLILNYTPWGIKLYPILISLAIFIAIISILAWYQRRRLPEAERFIMTLHLYLAPWRGHKFVDKLLSIILIATILGSIGTLSYVIATPKEGEKFTEFYILGLEGKADWYPTEFVMEGNKTILVRYRSVEAFQEKGEEYGRVTLGIVNHEHEEASYRVEVRINGERVTVWLGEQEVEELGPIVLEHEETWERETGYAPTEIGEGQKVEFVLYKDGELYFEDEESLHLWINVKEAS